MIKKFKIKKPRSSEQFLSLEPPFPQPPPPLIEVSLYYKFIKEDVISTTF